MSENKIPIHWPRHDFDLNRRLDFSDIDMNNEEEVNELLDTVGDYFFGPKTEPLPELPPVFSAEKFRDLRKLEVEGWVKRKMPLSKIVGYIDEMKRACSRRANTYSDYIMSGDEEKSLREIARRTPNKS